jgi:hypothetical protein
VSGILHGIYQKYESMRNSIEQFKNNSQPPANANQGLYYINTGQSQSTVSTIGSLGGFSSLNSSQLSSLNSLTEAFAPTNAQQAQAVVNVIEAFGNVK